MKTIDQIYKEMRDDYSRRTGLVVPDSGDMAVRMYATAAQIFSLWTQLDYVNRQGYPQTAEGDYLDLHAQVRGLTRRRATKARGDIRFYLSERINRNVVIKPGTVCLTAAGTEFITLEEGIIYAGELFCLVEAEARIEGTGGNVPEGSIVNMAQAPESVSSCSNPQGFYGGAGEEQDAQLRDRVLASYRKLPNGANKAYYEAQVLEVDGVSAVTVLPKKRGLGTVDIILSSEQGIPSEELLQTVRNKLDAQREICVDIAVRGPEPVPINISIAVKPDNNYSFQAVSQAVRASLENYFSGKVLGKNLLVAKLGNLIFQSEGVENYNIVLPKADIKINSDQLPVLGSISITEMGG